MKYQDIKVSESAREAFVALTGECADPDSYVRSTGEALAVYDHKWKKARVGGGDVAVAMADFILIGLAHVDALDMAGLRQQALGTVVTMLVSADMSGVSRVGLGMSFMRLHLLCAKGCIGLCARTSGDGFASAHAGALLRLEQVLYAGAYDEFVRAYSPDADDICEFAGMREAMRRYDGCRCDSEHVVARADAPAEALVDMMARLAVLDTEG